MRTKSYGKLVCVEKGMVPENDGVFSCHLNADLEKSPISMFLPKMHRIAEISSSASEQVSDHLLNVDDLLGSRLKVVSVGS